MLLRDFYKVYFVLTWLIFVICSHRHRVIQIPLIFTDPYGTNSTTVLELFYDQLNNWESVLNGFIVSHGFESERNTLHSLILNELKSQEYPDEILFSKSLKSENPTHITSIDASRKLSKLSTTRSLYSKPSDKIERIYFHGEKFVNSYHFKSHIVDDFLFLNTTNKNSSQSYKLEKSSSVPYDVRSNQLFIIYQSKGAFTGGTIALKTFYERLIVLGFPAFLCNDTNANHAYCQHPPVLAIVITGEWCHGVLEDYGINSFLGRGIQYHLGFHHWNDLCSGHITLTDSHYLWSSLSRRILNAYYMGCEMTYNIKYHLIDLLTHPTTSEMETETKTELNILSTENDVNQEMKKVQKENLVVFDPDYVTDYPPNGLSTFYLGLPVGTKVKFAKGVPAKDMPLLLQRAKVVVDLALPGPERLSGEGILMGAIPIISNRWNGGSTVDFPGVLRVDPSNTTRIEELISFVIRRYDDIIHYSHPSTTTSNDRNTCNQQNQEKKNQPFIHCQIEEDESYNNDDSEDLLIRQTHNGVSSFYSYIMVIEENEEEGRKEGRMGSEILLL